MPLITDVDVLRIEPSVFTDASAAATTLMSANDGAIAGTTLTSAASDFTAAGIEAGHVAVVGAEAVEIDERTAATTLEVSRPRVSSEDAKIAPAAGSGLAVAVRSFARLIDHAQAAMLAEVGVNENDPEQQLDESAIINLQEIGRVIGLRVAASAFAAAAALDPASESLAARASLYRLRVEAEARRIAAMIDLDGDGVADASRPLRLINFSRG